MAWMTTVTGVGLAALSAASAFAQTPPNYGFDFVTIGAPGNRNATQAEAPDLFPPNVFEPILTGGVDYEYRISRTEVTVNQWFEFVNAYWPFATSNPTITAVTGFWIRASNHTPGQNPGYYIVPGAENLATDPSWHTAARYVNWLHNGKVNQAWAFETGVYDTSTFTRNPDGTWNDQLTHSPEARYWIPTLSEWTRRCTTTPTRTGRGRKGIGGTRIRAIHRHSRVGRGKGDRPAPACPCGAGRTWTSARTRGRQAPGDCWMGQDRSRNGRGG